MAHELGAQFTLNKPVDPEQLVAAVAQAVAARVRQARQAN